MENNDEPKTNLIPIPKNFFYLNLCYFFSLALIAFSVLNIFVKGGTLYFLVILVTTLFNFWTLMLIFFNKMRVYSPGISFCFCDILIKILHFLYFLALISCFSIQIINLNQYDIYLDEI